VNAYSSTLSVKSLICVLVIIMFAPGDTFSGKEDFYAKSNRLVIGGTMEGVVSLGPGEYVVSDDIYVPPLSKLIIAPGTKFWFENRMRMEIAGELIAIGDSVNPITLTALPLKGYYRNPYTNKSLWEGVVITGNGVVVMHSTNVENAKYGIRAPDGCKKLRASNLILSNIEETIIELPGGKKDGSLDKPISLTFPVNSAIVPVALPYNQIAYKQLDTPRKLLIPALSGGALVFTGLSIFKAIHAKRESEKGIEILERAEKEMDNNSTGIPLADYEQWYKYYKRSRNDYIQMSLYGIIGASCTIGLVFSIPSPGAKQ